MARGRSLIPFMWDWPALQEEFSELAPFTGRTSDITISEDQHFVYVEAALPGVHPEDIEVTYDKGVLTIQGNRTETEEDKARKYYRKASRTFSYRIEVPGDLDEQAEPRGSCEKGVMIISFPKSKQSQPKRIQIANKDSI